MTFMKALLTISVLATIISVAESEFPHVGCYKREVDKLGFTNDKIEPTYSTGNDLVLDLWYSPSELREDGSMDKPEKCMVACKSSHFRYAGVLKSTKNTLECKCGSGYGQHGYGSCENCTHNPTEMCGSQTSFSIYDTNFKVPSPPQKVNMLQKTEDSLHVSWEEPMAPNGKIVGYRIQAQPMFSYSQEPLQTRSWEVLDTSQQQQYLVGLWPGSQYNISVVAVNSEGTSNSTSVVLWTKIGVPDTPTAPKVVRQFGSTMTMELEHSQNTKGPISSYQIILLDNSHTYYRKFDTMVTWNESMIAGYPYYIAAEFLPENLPRKFVAGNGGTYGHYYNGPLPRGHWHPKIGVVSSLDGFVETSYSFSSPAHEIEYAEHQHQHQHQDSVEDSEESGGVEIIEDDVEVVRALWIAIGVSATVLAACTAVYVVLKLNIIPKFRRRESPANQTRSEQHQLTPREPTPNSHVYSVDHSGAYTHMAFMHDEDMKGKILQKLQLVWNVPRNFMEIPTQDDEVPMIGKGRYGSVYLSTLRTNTAPVTVYSIPASYFKSGLDEDSSGFADPGKLFKDLDELVKMSSHENVVKLIGFMEDENTMLFVVEYGGISLKSVLLQYRQMDGKESVSSYSLLLCAMNIAEGMFHLQTFQVTHSQLATCNIQITDLEKPKITGFGLLSTNPTNETLDYTRWSAVEQFQNRCIRPCDSWAYGVLLWEIATLGGTPYHDIRSEDFPKRICVGARPTQTEGIGDALYQIMLYCWQLDRDERPDFSQLSCSIHELLSRSKDNLFISQGLNYPPYIHQYEHRAL